MKSCNDSLKMKELVKANTSLFSFGDAADAQ